MKAQELVRTQKLLCFCLNEYWEKWSYKLWTSAGYFYLCFIF